MFIWFLDQGVIEAVAGLDDDFLAAPGGGA